MITALETLKLFRFPAKTGVSEKAKLLWLIQLRWVAICLFFVLCAPALIYGSITRTDVPVYLGILGVLILFNLMSQMFINETPRPLGPLAICFQLAFDLLILTGLLSVSGGIGNPFVILFLLNVSLGGLLIPGRLTLPFLILSHTLLGSLQLKAVLANKGHFDMALLSLFSIYHLVLLGFWFVMRSLGAYLEAQNVRQVKAQVAVEKQDRLRSIGALAAGFSHEFASPLNVAKIRIERLRRQLGDSEDVIEAMKAIESCQTVIQQMNSSQMDSRDFQFKKLIAPDLLNDVIESWSEDKPKAQIKQKLEPALLAKLPPLNFAQVVMNLLDNAYEANPDGVIKISLEKQVDEICLRFEDEGPGFPESILRSRGEPFLTTKSNGTGLGLYVSDLFVQSLSGRLEIENLERQGARVSMFWPNRELS